MRLTAATVVLIFFALCSAAKANEMPPRSFFLDSPITMDGAEIPPGMYQLILEVDRSRVRVSLWHYGRFFATARGVWVKSAIKYTEDALVLHVNSDGTRTLTEIRLAGLPKTIVLGNSSEFVHLAPK